MKGFIAQGGDPNGDGTGGESIYGEPFKDEFHSRLRFNRRGLLAMANAGKDDNGSQFFFTLGPTPELQNKHTLFGKVSGQTVFNMLKLEEGVIVDESPEYPHKIIKAEVLNNPFPDIEPRELEKRAVQDEKPKVKQQGVKYASFINLFLYCYHFQNHFFFRNFKLLSFGEEAEEDEEESSVANTKYSTKGKSTHDLLDDPKLSSKTVENEKPESDEEVNLEEQLENIRAKLKSEKKKTLNNYYLNKDEKEEKKRKAEEIRQEIKKVKKEYHDNKLDREKEQKEIIKEEKTKSETFKEYKDEFDKYKEKKKEISTKGKSREDFTLKLLEKFKNKLESAREKEEKKETENSDESDTEESW